MEKTKNIVYTIKNSRSIMKDATKMSESVVKWDDNALREFQLYIFDIYKDIKRVCDKYNLRLYLIGGSALGAVRHHGFIPWDDDIDTSLTREDFEVFKKIFNNELSDNYLLISPNYSATPCRPYVRIMKKNSYYKDIIDNHNEELHHIFIDIFVLENVPDSKFIRYIKGYWCEFCNLVAKTVYVKENMTKELKEYYLSAGSINYYLRIVVGTLFSFMNSAKWYNYAERTDKWNKPSSCLGIVTGRKRYFGEIMERDKFLPGVEMEFEGEKVLIFTDYDCYLRNLYGDYMKIPPESERERHPIVNVKYSL